MKLLVSQCFLLLLLSILWASRGVAGDPKCLKIDLMFALSISNTTDPAFYNSTVKSFVKTLVDAFSTPDEVSGDSKQFARFAMLQSGGWISQHIHPFQNRSRAEVEAMVESVKYGVVSEHDGPMIEEQLSRSVWMLQGDWNGYGYTTLTTQRVLVLVTDQVRYEDEYNKLMYLYQAHGRWPVIFGVGMPGTQGNLVAQNISQMVEVVRGFSERAFPDVASALDGNTGILAQLQQLYQCGTRTCSGFGFLFEDADMSWVDGKIFMDAAVQVMGDLNSTEHGFDVQDSFGIHYSPMIADADTAIRHIQYYQDFTGFFSDFQNYTRATIFDLTLQIIDSGMYTNYGFFILAQTNTDWNYTHSLDMAYRVAATNVPVFVLDGSSSYFNTQELFKIVTHNRPERLINMTSVIDTDSLVQHLRQHLVPEFENLKCHPVAPVPPGRCGGLLFVSEMTRGIPDPAKSQFFGLSKTVAGRVVPRMDFSFAQFGVQVYHPLALVPLHEFRADVDRLHKSFNSTKQPNAQTSYMAPILTELSNFLQMNPDSKFKVVLQAEQELIRDPTSTKQLAAQIASLGSDIYVLDYSTGAIPVSVFPVLTGNKPGHVINATGLTAAQIVSKLTPMVTSLNNAHC